MLARSQIVQVQKSMFALLLDADSGKPTYQRFGQDVVGVYTRTSDVYGAAFSMGARSLLCRFNAMGRAPLAAGDA